MMACPVAATASSKNDADYESNPAHENNGTNDKTRNGTNADIGQISTGTLWDTLQKEFTNMGRALTCPLCLSTYQDAVVLPCVHAYCESCLKEAFSKGPPRCPTCMTKATRRSMAPAPMLNQLTKAYKLALRHFGLVPVHFDPTYNAMTQIAPGEAEAFELTLEPAAAIPNLSNSRRRKSANLVESHTQLLVSRTWERVLKERQKQGENEKRQMANATVQNSSRCNRQNQNRTFPANIPTSGRLDEWYQQQQASVIASHERALIDAAKDRQQPSPEPPSLSMQDQISMAQALEQEVADQQAELEEETLLLQQEEEERKKREQQQQIQQAQSDKEGEQEERIGKAQAGQQAHQHSGLQRNVTFKGVANTSSREDSNPYSLSAKSTNTQEYTPREAASPTVHTKAESGPSICQNAYSQRTVTGAHSLMGFALLGLDAGPTLSEDQSLLMTASFATSDTRAFNNDQNTDDGRIPADSHVVTATDPTDECSLTKSAYDDHPSRALARAEKRHRAVDTDADNKPNEARKPGARQTLVVTADAAPIFRQPARLNVATATPLGNSTPLLSSTKSRLHKTSCTENKTEDNVAQEANDTSNNQVDNRNYQNSNSSAEDTIAGSTAGFKVGDIVEVQSRTWPGVNKPGGIARISEVGDVGSYNVTFILGGKEKNVDALFLSLPPEEMNWTSTAASAYDSACKEEAGSYQDESFVNPSVSTVTSFSQRERKSRRISSKRQVIEDVVEEHHSIFPPDLVKKLAAEGFDVTPMAVKDSVMIARERKTAYNSVASEGKPQLSRRGPGAPAVPTKRKSTDINSDPNPLPHIEHACSKKRGRARQNKKTVLKATSKEAQEQKDSHANNARKAPPETKDLQTPKTAARKAKPPLPDASETVPQQELPLHNHKICALADEAYRKRVQAGLNNSSLCVVASGLSLEDRTALKALLKEAKHYKNGGRYFAQFAAALFVLYLILTSLQMYTISPNQRE
jgi:Zinc finger, C3HC4 type (RING finger)